MTKKLIGADEILNQARPLTHQQAHEIQPYGHLVRLPIALAENVCKESVESLNQLLADTMTLRDLTRSTTGRWPGLPSISCTCCSTNITSNRTNWWTKLPNESSC